jgi:hypothetical protein
LRLQQVAPATGCTPCPGCALLSAKATKPAKLWRSHAVASPTGVPAAVGMPSA